GVRALLYRRAGRAPVCGPGPSGASLLVPSALDAAGDDGPPVPAARPGARGARGVRARARPVAQRADGGELAGILDRAAQCELPHRPPPLRQRAFLPPARAAPPAPRARGAAGNQPVQRLPAGAGVHRLLGKNVALRQGEGGFAMSRILVVYATR